MRLMQTSDELSAMWTKLNGTAANAASGLPDLLAVSTMMPTSDTSDMERFLRKYGRNDVTHSRAASSSGKCSVVSMTLPFWRGTSGSSQFEGTYKIALKMVENKAAVADGRHDRSLDYFERCARARARGTEPTRRAALPPGLLRLARIICAAERANRAGPPRPPSLGSHHLCCGARTERARSFAAVSRALSQPVTCAHTCSPTHPHAHHLFHSPSHKPRTRSVSRATPHHTTRATSRNTTHLTRHTIHATARIALVASLRFASLEVRR